MTALDRLYQEMILEHNRKPRNFKVLEKPTHISHGVNPLCGDDYYIFLTVEDGIIKDVGFKGVGCAISKSSASMMSTMIKNKPVKDVMEMKECFISRLTRETETPECDTILGNLTIFEGVKAFPVRVKCATLIWRALEDAILHQKKPKEDRVVTTE
ncbi:MAG: SUF system NifU family Fe-S cluster assembly protein [Candidatus Margulisbacteria bacterium]|nr:SUF system NifU family Fe-S cluster assembly protein [Candidatus Margulisiibacteriota bacterium]